LQGLHSEGTDYVGFLFFGLILVDGAPYVIEYNCRLGDPETQAVLPRIENDFVELLKSCVADTLKADQLKISENTTVCTILASEGYPGSYEKGKEVHIQNQNRNIILAHAGTARKNGQLITSGGRVMGSIGLDISPKRAKMKSQKGAASVQFKGKYFRSDIGSDLGI
jgi:phosphoribosylamine--glycine ligase